MYVILDGTETTKRSVETIIETVMIAVETEEMTETKIVIDETEEIEETTVVTVTETLVVETIETVETVMITVETEERTGIVVTITEIVEIVGTEETEEIVICTRTKENVTKRRELDATSESVTRMAAATSIGTGKENERRKVLMMMTEAEKFFATIDSKE